MYVNHIVGTQLRDGMMQNLPTIDWDMYMYVN